MSKGTCSVDGCGRPIRTAEMCNGHRLMLLAGQPLRPIRPKRPNGTVGTVACEFAGCDRVDFKVGLCVGHYEQRSKGQALRPIKHYMPGGIPLPAVRNEHGHKWCPSCSQWLAQDAFHKSSRQPDGLCGSCKDCGRVHARLTVFRRYSITEQRYDEILAAQGGVCAICKKDCRRGSLSVDHDHTCCPGVKSCGKCVRGLLCRTCNQALGNLRDDPTLMRAAADYVESERATTNPEPH